MVHERTRAVHFVASDDDPGSSCAGPAAWSLLDREPRFHHSPARPMDLLSAWLGSRRRVTLCPACLARLARLACPDRPDCLACPADRAARRCRAVRGCWAAMVGRGGPCHETGPRTRPADNLRRDRRMTRSAWP